MNPSTRRLALILGTVSVVMIADTGCKMTPQGSEGSKPLTYADQLHALWNNEMSDIINEQLGNGTLPYKEIVERYNAITDNIHRASGMNPILYLRTKYCWVSSNIVMAAGIKNDGQRVIQIYMPREKDEFDQLRALGKPHWRKVFQTHLIISYMHELEHLNNVSYRPKVDDIDDIDEESRAWADTCRYDIAPLVDKYRPTFMAHDLNIYLTWLRAGQCETNAYWRHTMEQLYHDYVGRASPGE